MLSFLAEVERKTFVDKYSILRNMKCHVYGEKEISAAQPLRAEYLKFWNEECLHLAKLGKKKEVMEYLVKKAWNGSGQFDAYLKVGEEVGHLHKLAVEWQTRGSGEPVSLT